MKPYFVIIAIASALGMPSSAEGASSAGSDGPFIFGYVRGISASLRQIPSVMSGDEIRCFTAQLQELENSPNYTSMKSEIAWVSIRVTKDSEPPKILYNNGEILIKTTRSRAGAKCSKIASKIIDKLLARAEPRNRANEGNDHEHELSAVLKAKEAAEKLKAISELDRVIAQTNDLRSFNQDGPKVPPVQSVAPVPGTGASAAGAF
ncbi:MAG TPA: hypothetical protein VJB59_09030 [Bdellovibrionota bacterium]|nr:hypothetical protein [Bdellovibrionota bacterium]